MSNQIKETTLTTGFQPCELTGNLHTWDCTLALCDSVGLDALAPLEQLRGTDDRTNRDWSPTAEWSARAVKLLGATLYPGANVTIEIQESDGYHYVTFWVHVQFKAKAAQKTFSEAISQVVWGDHFNRSYEFFTARAYHDGILRQELTEEDFDGSGNLLMAAEELLKTGDQPQGSLERLDQGGPRQREGLRG